MEALKKARGPVRARVTKIIQAIEEELRKANADKNVIKVKVSRLETHYAKLKEWDEQIETQLLDDGADEAATNEESTAVEDYEEKVELVRVRVEEFLHPVVRPPSPSASSFDTASEARQKRNYSLPKIELKKFSGDVKEWLGFWAQFSKIHDDDELHASDKFQYLSQCIVKNSAADKVLECYPQSEENYPKVVAALKEHFGNPRVLLDVYIRELI